MIHWISPFSKDKNIGLAINAAVSQLRPAPEDWVIHCDQDVLFLRPDTKAHIIDILENTQYDVLGCMTNRLGDTEQRVAGMFSNDSISDHVKVAEHLWQTEDTRVIPADNIAAMMMCFRKSVWDKVGRFDEKRLNFDTLFCYRARKAGFKLGLMKGIYVFHLYRWGSVDPQNSYRHLIP